MPIYARILLRATLLWALLLPLSAQAGDSLVQEMAALLAPYEAAGARFSIHIAHLKTGQELYAYHPKRALNPASTMKLLTSVAALELLGPQHRFLTECYASGPIGAGQVPDLWLKGYGDPYLVSGELDLIAQGLKKRGIHTVAGPLYIDDSYFAREEPEKFIGTTGRGLYRVVTGALSYQFNPPGVLKGQARSLRTRLIGSTERLERSVVLSDEILDPAYYTGLALARALNHYGIRLQGELRFGVTPVHAELLLIHESRPLDEIMWWLNKQSHNFLAEQLFYAIGAARFGSPATREKGAQTITELLARLGPAKIKSVVGNGSGLSRGNRIAASQLTRLLQYAATQPYAEYFIRSLSIGGVDGTLWRRLQGSLLQGKLWAKTGSLYQVSALAGYLLAGEEPLVFAILVNDFNHDYHHMQEVQDSILERVAGRLSGKS